VSNQIDVVSATGATGGDRDVDNVTLVVKKSPGSDPIDLSQATIEYTSSSESETLVRGTSATASDFSSASIVGGNATILEDTDQRIEIEINTTAIEGGLAEGEDAQLKIVDQSGAETVYGVNVPDVLTGDYAEV
jgi:archaellin